MKRLTNAFIVLYGWLVRLYPAGFQEAFGEEMRTVFEDAATEASSRGLGPLMRVWLRELRDWPGAIASAYRLWVFRARTSLKPREGAIDMDKRDSVAGEYSDALPTWKETLLCILPGLFALGSEVGLWERLFHISPAWRYWELFFLCVLVCGAGLILRRRFPSWSFPALGILLALGMQSSSLLPASLFPGLTVRYQQTLSNLISLLAIFSVLPAIVSLLLARRAGVLSGLVFVGSVFVIWEGLDPEYALLLHTDHQIIETIVSIHPQVFLLILAPILVLRAQSIKARIAGFLLPLFVAFFSAAAIRGVVRLHSSFTFAPNPVFDILWPLVFDVLVFLLPLAIALRISGRVGRSSQPDQPSFTEV